MFPECVLWITLVAVLYGQADIDHLQDAIHGQSVRGDFRVSVTELFAKDRKYNDLLPYLTCRGTSHGYHHQQFWEV